METLPSTQWSSYQESIFNWAKNPQRHLMVKAGAGCGKTTTIVELYKRIIERNHNLVGGVPPTILFMAFNKKIADELGTRGVPAMTMNSFGYRTVLKQYPKIKLEVNKIRYLCKRYNVEYKKTGLVSRVVDLLKAYLYPMNGTTIQNVQQIIQDFELSEEPVKDDLASLIKSVFIESLQDLNTMDFADQICYPIYHNLTIPKYDYVIIDEAQDLSPNKLELVSRAVGSKFICVGDPFQAIYGFCGADSDSMNKISQQFDPEIKSLPVTYRCGKNIVNEAKNKKVAPEDFQAGPNNHEGVVESITKEAFEKDVKPKDFVLCRVSAPLVSGCFGLIKKGIRAQIVGKDIGQKLITLIDKINDYNCYIEPTNNQPMTQFCAKYGEYKNHEVGKLLAAEKETSAEILEDQLECLYVFTEGCKTIDEMKQKIQMMFDDTINPHAVIFSTIHKAKGLEADRVFCLPYKAKKSKKEKQQQEERNLLYVQITRAKFYLGWVK